MTRAYVTPDVLRWARESRGLNVDDAAKRIGVKPAHLTGAENGERQLTLRQAEKAADLYDRPLAALYLPEPPVEEPQSAQFRRLPGAPKPPWPAEMQILARRVRERQAAATDLLLAIDEKPAWPRAAQELALVNPPLPEMARQALGIDLDEQGSWRDYTGYTPLRRWVDAVEDLGILVMQDGTVDVKLMRGFAAVDPQIPAIVVNTRDSPRARVFTIIHELGHLYVDATGGGPNADTEAWCDEFAGEVLIPRAALEEALPVPATDPTGAIDELALSFGVSSYAAAVRVSKTDLWPRRDVKEAISVIRARGAGSGSSGGGDYYWGKIGRLGPSFIHLVFAALDSQAVTYPAASGLLDGVKVSHFDTLREYLDRRTATP